MSEKSISAIKAPPPPHYVGDGFRVHNFIPGQFDMKRFSPFLMMDYNSKYYFPPSEKPKGVDVHPHRGFETVTIAYKGKVAHHDSFGNSGVIEEGDVQWMTAASGILHKEYHEEEFSRSGGDFQMVQLWVNLPAKDKMSPPKYQAISNDMIKRYISEDNLTEIEVIAGNHKGVDGIAQTFSAVHLFNSKMKAAAEEMFTFPQDFNTSLLVIDGEIMVNKTSKVVRDHFVLFENDGETFEIKALKESIVLILSGAPIDEPIAAHGPFVMNTRAEIMQAFDDYHAGKFGSLV
ncbi:MAG: pirin family protein [Saprospiraceae bacterium]|jgi:redox-sensitive bicupin YhaK (pirin superfamily)|nr:pirin family protein [Saprospiraceae bacterium]